MDIQEAAGGEAISAGKIRIAPGDVHMIIEKWNGGAPIVGLAGTAPENGVRPSADVLFRSVADHCEGKQTLVVVLTGMGHDGSAGIKRLKESGNCYCITQSEQSSVAYGMPGAIYGAGHSDETVDLEMIGFRIGQICNDVYNGVKGDSEKADLRPLCEWIETETGISAKKQMDLILPETLEEFGDISKSANVNTLLKRLSNGEDSQLLQNLIEAVTIHETYWFRDRVPWRVLEETLPAVFQEFCQGDRKEFRIWSAACSTGQEPYSIAMFLDQWARRKGLEKWLDHIQIVGTDISKRSLQEARQGVYSEMALTRRLSEEYWTTYFERVDGRWMIDKRIQTRVEFDYGNLLKDIVKEESFDIIFIKNVLIYFSDKAKREVLTRLPNRLKENGMIFLGESELMEDPSGQLEKVFLESGYYFRRRR